MKLSLKIAFTSLCIAALTACGGGGTDSTVSQTSTGFQVEGGLAQKGPLLKNSRVTIAELNPLNYAPVGLTYDLLTKDNLGGFNSAGISFTRQHIQTFAQGNYFNEITGELANDTVLLQAQGDLYLDRLVNVNLLTTLAAPRIVKLVTDNTNATYYRKFEAARVQAQKEVLAAFRIYNGADLMSGDTSTTVVTVPANFSELDIGKAAVPNKILVALSALAVQTGVNGVGISQFIANFQTDLTDDGLINGSAGSTTVLTSIHTASKAVNLTTVAAKLTEFYATPAYNIFTSAPAFTAAQLTPWVDSSGGVDMVLDSFKFVSATNVASGAVSKSTAYVAGTDDVGQCFSVVSSVASGVAGLYLNGTTTAVTGTVKVVKGDSLVLGLSASVAGTYSGFIQRSALPATGCPTAVPTTGTTRVQKYTMSVLAVPGAPLIGSATPGTAQADIAYSAPSSTGGSAITGYTASCTASAVVAGATATPITAKSATASSTSITVKSLGNGTAYTCSVTATNSVGDSLPSGTVSVTTTATAPAAPTGVAVTYGLLKATVAFTAPTSNGGSAITGYTASCQAGTATAIAASTTSASSGSIEVTGLANGTAYACSVVAKNAQGSSPVSSIVSVTPGVVPGAPTIDAGTAGAEQATVAFTPSATSGTLAVTSYTASCVAGTATFTAAASTLAIRTIVVPGLVNGTAYLCSVKATNAVGPSLASGTVSVTPLSATISTTIKPTTPVMGTATPGGERISVAFTQVAGAISYSVTCAPATASLGATITGTSTPIVVTGLTGGVSHSCTMLASNAGGNSPVSAASSATPITTTYSAPLNFSKAIDLPYTPTLTAATALVSRSRYMISNTATATTATNSTAAYLTIGSSYDATTGFAVTSSMVVSAATYRGQLSKLIQAVAVADGYFRLDSHLHPNNSIDADSTDALRLKFRNNFGKAATTYGYVTFAYANNKLQAQNRYKYTYTSATTSGNTAYTGAWTKDADFTGSGYYVNLSSAGVYSLVLASTSATSLTLYNSPLDLGMPTFMNPNSVAFVTNGPAPFLSKTTTLEIEGSTGTTGTIVKSVNATYTKQVTIAGADPTTKGVADAFLLTMKAAVEATGEKLRYTPAVYTAFRDALLATKLVSDSIADGAPNQNLVPYVYFTNEMDLTTGKYHPFMVVVSYGNQASPNGLKDVPHPPAAGTDYKTANVTRFSNLENYIFMIPMKDYGQVTSLVTENTNITSNLWTVGNALNSKILADVYTFADIADNGILIDGSVIFPTFNNVLVPSHLQGELSASGCHVGQGGGGPHCHADGYQAGSGLGLYNDSDYANKTHPPMIGFGYDGIALFAKYRTTTDINMLGASVTLDQFGAHNHDGIGYHYHAHVVTNFTYQDPTSLTGATISGCTGTGCTTTIYPLMKGAYVGKTTLIPFFRAKSAFNTNKYMGGTVK